MRSRGAILGALAGAVVTLAAFAAMVATDHAREIREGWLLVALPGALLASFIGPILLLPARARRFVGPIAAFVLAALAVTIVVSPFAEDGTGDPNVAWERPIGLALAGVPSFVALLVAPPLGNARSSRVALTVGLVGLAALLGALGWALRAVRAAPSEADGWVVAEMIGAFAVATVVALLVALRAGRIHRAHVHHHAHA